MKKGTYTLSVIKADVGGDSGHSDVHPDLLAKADECMVKGKGGGVITDFCRSKVGDDIILIMTHDKGPNSTEVHELAWNTFDACGDVAEELAQYGARQDLLADAFSGNVKGMGPGCAEFDIEVRKSEPIIVYAADKTEPGAWNLPLYKIFADPFNTIGLVIDEGLHEGFDFLVTDLFEHRDVLFSLPEDMYDMLVLIGAPSRFVIKRVMKKGTGEIVAATSTQKLIEASGGRYVGKDDPVMIVRCQSGLPAVGEALEPFAFPHSVAGWMRGSHHGPLMPVGVKDATPTRFDGPPRVIALGFQLRRDGMLGHARDHFVDISYNNARQRALDVADYLRQHGPFEPNRLPLQEMEYTTMPTVMKKLENRFVKAED